MSDHDDHARDHNDEVSRFSGIMDDEQGIPANGEHNADEHISDRRGDESMVSESMVSEQAVSEPKLSEPRASGSNRSELDAPGHSDAKPNEHGVESRGLSSSQLTMLKRVVIAGLVCFAVSMFTPGNAKILMLNVVDVMATIGFLLITIPLLFVAVRARGDGVHGGTWYTIWHMYLPFTGILMVLARLIMGWFPVSSLFTNIWGIAGTFLVFPLVQQLIELLSGGVDMDNGGRQVRYQE